MEKKFNLGVLNRFLVKASVPTHYQYGALSLFGKPQKINFGGFEVAELFDSVEEARAYLRDRASVWLEQNGTEEDATRMMCEIRESNSLKYDSVIATIDPVETDLDAVFESSVELAENIMAEFPDAEKDCREIIGLSVEEVKRGLFREVDLVVINDSTVDELEWLLAELKEE